MEEYTKTQDLRDMDLTPLQQEVLDSLIRDLDLRNR